MGKSLGTGDPKPARGMAPSLERMEDFMKGKFIYHIADEQTYEDGQIIFREDTPGDWV